MQVTKNFLLKSSTQLSNRNQLHGNVYFTRRCRAEALPDVETSNSKSPLPTPKVPTFVNSVVERPPDSLDDIGQSVLVGEDAAVFDVEAQKTSSWIYFTLVLGVVLAILYYIWLDPNTGYGGAFIDVLSSLSSNHEVSCEIICINRGRNGFPR